MTLLHCATCIGLVEGESWWGIVGFVSEVPANGSLNS